MTDRQGWKMGQQTKSQRKLDALIMKQMCGAARSNNRPTHLQKSSSLKELQGLLDGVVQAMVASSGQIGSDQSHSNHQPSAAEAQKCDLRRK